MPDEKETTSQEAQSDDQQQSPDPKLSLPPNQTAADQAETQHIQEQGNEKKKRAAKRSRRKRWRLTEQRLQVWIPVIISALVFFVTCAGIFYSYRQWQSMEKSLRVSQRAYVGIGDIKAEYERHQIVITLENVGHVPAEEVNVHVTVHRGITGQTLEENSYDFGAFGIRNAKIFPGTFKTLVVVPLQGFTQEDADLIRKNEEFVALSFTVEYKDGFGVADRSRWFLTYRPPPNEQWSTISIRPYGEDKKFIDEILKKQKTNKCCPNP